MWSKKFVYVLNYSKILNPIQDGGVSKSFPLAVFSLTSTNVGISSQNSLTFSFNPFDRLL